MEKRLLYLTKLFAKPRVGDICVLKEKNGKFEKGYIFKISKILKNNENTYIYYFDYEIDKSLGNLSSYFKIANPKKKQQFIKNKNDKNIK